MFLCIPFIWVLIAKKERYSSLYDIRMHVTADRFGVFFFLLVFFIRDKGISAICRGVFNEIFKSIFFFKHSLTLYIEQLMDPYAPDVIHFSWNRKIYPLLNYDNRELITTILIHIKLGFFRLKLNNMIILRYSSL